ncbi:hypothetical protein [Pseudarthrobacter sulfonivorans]|uniref:hypothetical protein n=1 Tax=Pseudarthrobacter sulfonivorans TaxID=121292 RepID=UPI002865A289|nr:hypothetical protein [Pseudarthrobacter sulfonivorans]MDR6416451.1 hypothetical protein [Pseudarthrobacter sulfonivorans]
MRTTVQAQLPNAIFLVLGSEDPTLPDVDAEGLVWVSENALIIGGTNDMDGETIIHVSGQAPTGELIQLDRRMIQCPAGRLTLETVFGDNLLQYEVPVGSAKIGIWIDDLAEPGIVHLQVS